MKMEITSRCRPVFISNFISPQNPKITEFEKCDFRPIWEKLQADKEKKKQMTKEEKQRLKEEKAKREEPYLYAWVDGRKEKVGNFRLEPPELFRGRGDHPKTGSLKVYIHLLMTLGKRFVPLSLNLLFLFSAATYPPRADNSESG